MHDTDELSVCLADINGHVGRHTDGFDVHRWYGVGQRNSGGNVLLESCFGERMCVKYVV